MSEHRRTMLADACAAVRGRKLRRSWLASFADWIMGTRRLP